MTRKMRLQFTNFLTKKAARVDWRGLKFANVITVRGEFRLLIYLLEAEALPNELMTAFRITNCYHA